MERRYQACWAIVLEFSLLRHTLLAAILHKVSPLPSSDRGLPSYLASAD